MIQRLLFLDDERYPPQRLTRSLESYTVARTVADAIRDVQQHGLPSILSLDHDLGAGDSAMDFVNWLIDGDLNDWFDLRSINTIVVHSANPVGADNLVGKLESFFRHRDWCSYTLIRMPATTWEQQDAA